MILRDPVHGLVAFEGEEEGIVERLLDTPEVQRLRRVRQLGRDLGRVPGGRAHSRFAHAIGAAFVMKLLLARLRAIHGGAARPRSGSRAERAREAIAAAFLHDLGHGPLSHLFEDAIPGAPRARDVDRAHRARPVDRRAPRARRPSTPPCRRASSSWSTAGTSLPYLAKAVSGELDVDRCDYLLRDAHATGVRYGVYDLDWLLRSLRFAPSTATRSRRRSRSTAPRGCRPSRRSSRRASSCSSRCTCTRRRARPSG